MSKLSSENKMQYYFPASVLIIVGVSRRLDSNIERKAASEPKHREYKCGLVATVDQMRLGWNFAESVSGQRGARTEMGTVHGTLNTRQA